MHLIYLTTNLVNNKTYVGQRTLKNNSGDSTYLGSGRLIKAAIKKYGRENFSRQTLIIIESRKEADEYEKQFIEMYRLFGKCQYNIADGGHGSNGNRGIPHTEEHKKRISEAQKGKQRHPLTEEHKEKIRQAMLGRKCPWATGHAHSEASKAKISAAKKGVKFSAEHRAKLSAAAKGRTPWNKGMKGGRK